MDKPRFLFVTKHHLLNTVGGSEEQCWLLSREFVQRGWDVHYVSEWEKLPEPHVIDGVTLHGLPVRPMPWSGDKGRLRKLIRDLKPDVIYNSVFDVYTGYAFCATPPGIFRIWTGAGESDGFVWRKLRLFWRNFGTPRFLFYFPLFFRWVWVARRGVRAADLVLAQRIEQFDDLSGLGLKPVLIRNTQASVPDEEVQRHEGDPVVLWAGSIKEWKRPEKFIELARRCADLPAQFVMIGKIQHPMYHQILKDAEGIPNFRYDGAIPLAEVGKYFSRAHLFVCTSISEGYPTTFIQAWQRGVPVVSLDVVNPERLLTEKGFGAAVPTLDEMERVVRELLADSMRRRKMGLRARAFAQEEYELSKTADRLEAEMAARGVRLPEKLNAEN